MYNLLLTFILIFSYLTPGLSDTPNPTEEVKRDLAASCVGAVNFPEYCLRIYAEGRQVNYEELRIVTWCESTFATWKTGDLDFNEYGSSGLIQIAWEQNAVLLQKAGFTREDLYDPYKALEAMEYLQRKSIWRYYNWDTTTGTWVDDYPDWDEYWDYVLNDTDLYDYDSVPAEARWWLWSCRKDLAPGYRTKWHNHVGTHDPYFVTKQELADSIPWALDLYTPPTLDEVGPS